MSDLLALVETLPSYDGKGRATCPVCFGGIYTNTDQPWCESGCSSEQIEAALGTRPTRCTERHNAFDSPADKCPTCWAEKSWARREGERRSASDDGGSWAATSLTEAPDVPAPSILEVGEGTGDYLLRRGWVTLIHGRFASAKTPVCYIAVVEQARQGRCSVIVDYEMGASGAAALLRDLGLTAEELDRFVYYVERPSPLSPSGARRVVEDLAERGMDDVAVVVLDSLTQSMATVPHASDNDALDVTTWADEMPIWFARQFDAAVLVIDHSALTDGDRPSGSHKKREFPQFHLWCRLDSAFSKEKPDEGKSTLVVKKDRSGERSIDVEVAGVRTRPGGSFYLAPSDVTKPGEAVVPGDKQPEGGTERDVIDGLLAAGDEGVLRTPLCGSGAAGKYRRIALDALIADGWAVERADPANSRARRVWAKAHAPE